MYLHHLYSLFIQAKFIKSIKFIIDFCNFSVYKKRRPEDDVNKSKHVRVFCDKDIIDNML